MPRAAAAMSIRRSRTKLDSNRPGARYVAVGVRLETTQWATRPVGADVVRAGKHREREVGHPQAVAAHVGAVVGPELGGHGEDAAVGIDGHRGVVDLLAGVVGGDEVLLSVLDPAHRPAQPPRRPGDEEVLRVVLAAHPEPPAHRCLAHGDPRRRQSEVVGELGAVGVRNLGRAVDDETVGERVVLGDEPPGLHRHAGVPAGPISSAWTTAAARWNSGVDVTELGRQVGDEVADGEQRLGPSVASRSRRTGKRSMSTVDELGGVLGDVRDRSPRRRPPVHRRSGPDRRRARAGGTAPPVSSNETRGWMTGTRPRSATTSAAVHTATTPGTAAAALDVECGDPAMGDLGPHDAQVQHAGKAHVSDVAGGAPQERDVLVTSDRAPMLTTATLQRC